MFNTLNQLRQNNGNPNKLYQETIGKFTPEQMNNFTNLAKQFGFSDEMIKPVSTNHNNS